MTQSANQKLVVGLLVATVIALTVRITDSCEVIHLRNLMSPTAEHRVIEEQVRCASGKFETNVWLSRASTDKRINLLNVLMPSEANREGKTPVLELDIVWTDYKRLSLAYPEGVAAKTFPGEHDGVLVDIIKGKVIRP